MVGDRLGERPLSECSELTGEFSTTKTYELLGLHRDSGWTILKRPTGPRPVHPDANHDDDGSAEHFRGNEPGLRGVCEGPRAPGPDRYGARPRRRRRGRDRGAWAICSMPSSTAWAGPAGAGESAAAGPDAEMCSPVRGGGVGWPAR